MKESGGKEQEVYGIKEEGRRKEGVETEARKEGRLMEDWRDVEEKPLLIFIYFL